MSKRRDKKVIQRRAVPVAPGFGNWAVNNVSTLITLATICCGFAGFYFNTATSIEAQAKSITKIETKLADAEKKDEKQQREVITERTTLRSEMTQRAEKTAEGIASLNEKTAVLSSQLSGIQVELAKIANQLTAQSAASKR